MQSFKRARHGFWIVLILAACSSVEQDKGAVDLRLDERRKEVASYLTPKSRTFLRPIDQSAEGQELVEIEIAEVVNPEKIRVIFEVHFRHEEEKVLLGTFGLYPPDEPGTFLVTTQGRLAAEGSIVLTMEVLDEVEPGSPLQVGVGLISFRKE